MKKIADVIYNICKTIFLWIFCHKKIVFIYLPIVITLLTAGYVGFIYVKWRGDKDAALVKLAKYKKLIDQTESLRRGRTYAYQDLDLGEKVVKISTKIYDRNEDLIGELFDEKREIVPYDFIPNWIKIGVIASEDRNFYNHKGVSIKGIFRAMLVNLVNLKVAQGGSTLTQQLAKVLFTDMERNFKRKIYEAFCALEIEKKYDKDDILSMYLNLIYFGNGAYGVEAASKMFFEKSVTEIDIVESAMIVASISNPKYYSPISNFKYSLNKTKRILQSILAVSNTKEVCSPLKVCNTLSQQKINYKLKKFIKKWDITYDKQNKTYSTIIGSFAYSSYRINRAPFFNEYIRRTLVEKFGEDVVKKGGLSVYTTLNGFYQDIALKTMRGGIENQREYHTRLAAKIRNKNQAKIELEKAENIEGALISIDPQTGEILAYVGGYAFSSKNQNDHATQIRRQPGSSFKPLVYTAAIEDRTITPSTIMVDEKTVFKGGYSPGNYDKTFFGKMTTRQALCKSINIIAVKVLEKTGYDRIDNYLSKSLDLSKSETRKRFGNTLSMALGTYELAPIENCRLHAIIVNGGDYIHPYGIKYVKDYNGNIVLNNEETILRLVDEKRKDFGKIIDPAATAITVSMLEGFFDKSVKKWIKFPIAGKTGTTSNHHDAWFVGYTSKLVTAIWIGNKKGAISLGPGRSGGAIATPLWTRYITTIFNNKKPGPFFIPETKVTKETICLESGKVALKDGSCPHTAVQLFYAGTEPGEYCKIHEKKDNDPQKNN